MEIEQKFRKEVTLEIKKNTNPLVSLRDGETVKAGEIADKILSTTIGGYCLAIVEMDSEFPELKVHPIETVLTRFISDLIVEGYTHKIVKLLGKEE